MRVVPYIMLIIAVSVNAQSINISNFYYRDYLDFGQNKGVFKKSKDGLQIIGKDGKTLTIPHIPNFSASSNYGSLTSVGRGFTVTANHVSSPESVSDLRKWGLTNYNIANVDSTGISTPYGADTKFLRLNKYIVEGQVEMLDIANSTKNNGVDEGQNLIQFKSELDKLKDSDDSIYLYQAGSGIVTLRNGSQTLTRFDTDDSGTMRGSGFGTLNVDGINYQDLVGCGANCDIRGISFNYKPDPNFQNLITSGDSGSGIYAYDSKNQKWILLGVVSQTYIQLGLDEAKISFASNKDFTDYQSKFEQKIDLSNSTSWSVEKPVGGTLEFKNNGDSTQLQWNKDLVFSGGGNVEVKADIDRTQSGYAGGFVFMAGNSATSANPTTYKFTNASGENHSFKGSGLDIGENVRVEWALKGTSGDSLHKIGKGELIIKMQNAETTGLGALKIGEGKVTLDTDKKAFDNIYITSGRGELSLIKDKAEALGATKNTTRGDSPNADSYTLSQDSASNMGFYFGTGGGKLDLGGNNLTLNTIVANDSGATITSATKATLEIQGFGYDDSGNKTTAKKDTIIHATISESNSTNGENIDIIHKSDTKDDNAHLIFDGNINTSGSLSAISANIALQGHATAHATISNETIRNQVATAESGTQKGLPDYMDLNKPSTLNQPDWDNRSFKFGSIDLKGANLTLGRNATLESNITLDSTSKVEFGGSVKHFIDNKDGKNVTGSGFSYQQKVEGGNLSDEQQQIANHTISYKGKITATGSEIQSHIFDFNASLDLKSGAKLTADYLTLTNSDSVALASGASATIQNLVLKNVSDLSGKFTIDSSSGTKFEVQKSFWFDNSTFDLQKLDSTSGLIKNNNYDIVGVKSTITGTNKDLSANIELFEGANLSLKNLTLKNIDDSTLKNSVYLDNDSQGSDFTKLSLTESLRTENLEKVQIVLKGKSEISAPKIEFSGVQNGILALDSEAKLTGANGNANVEVSGENSMLNIGILGDKSFNLNAQGGSKITLGLFEPSDKSQTVSANFSGKITAKDSSLVATDLDNITASVNLSGSATLNAIDIVLENGYNSINLSDTATLTAQTITAKNLTDLTLNATNSANVDIKSFIFDGGTTNLMGNLIGKNITLQNNSVVKNGDLSFSSNMSVTFDDKDSKLEVTNLKVTSGNLSLNFADSTKNAEKITKIELNGGNVNINSWDFGNSTAFSNSDKDSRVTFQNATYIQNNTSKTISADSTISQTLTLSNVGGDSTKGDSRFKTLTFENKNLTFGENSKIQVSLDSSIKKGETGINLDTYYTLISAGSIFDNRADSRIDFIFDSSISDSEKFFVVSKFDDKNQNLLIKFLKSAPNTFDELNKQISHTSTRYSEILKALTEAHPNDEAIDIATRTDNYKVLNEKIESIDNTMNEIAQSNKTRLTQNLLFSNDYTINTRIVQVRLAQSASKKHLQFAHNDAMYRIQSLIQGAVRSDATPSYGTTNENLPNSVWLNVGGGYFGGDSKMGFGATNIGYDRTFSGANGDAMIGAMIGFGGSKAQTNGLSENALFYNIGLYLHSLFDTRSGQYGGHELQGNLNFSINDNSKSYNSQSAKNTALGTLFSVYYKYNFIIASDDKMSHALKPVVLLAFGYNRNGSYDTGTYKQSAYTNTNLSYGLGVEYNAVWNEHFYSIGFVFKDMAWNTTNNVQLSLSGARNFIGYSIESASRFSTELNIVGSHKITPSFYLQYGIAGMIDSGKNYGAKGDIKFGYRF